MKSTQEDKPVSTRAFSLSNPGIIFICLKIFVEVIVPPPGCGKIMGTAALYDGG